MGKINLLFLTSHLPYPLISGGRLREHELIIRLSKYCNIYLCVVTKTYDMDRENMNYFYKYCKGIRVFKSPDILSYHKDNNKKIPLQVKRNNSNEARLYIFELLKANIIDIVHMEGFYMHQLLPDISINASVVLAEQNIEYLLYKQREVISENILEKAEFYEQFKITQEYELDVWKQVDSCIFLTDSDQREAKKFISSKKARLIPNGADHLLRTHTDDDYAVTDVIDKNYILYIGNFDYQPNVDAAKYLIECILTKVKEHIKDLKLYVVGNSGKERLGQMNFCQDVIITGRVKSLKPYFKKAKFCVFPLRIGGGIKVKILEALQNQKVVITTSIGAQGIPINNSRAIIVNDNETDIVKSIISLYHEDEAELRKREKTCKDIINSLPTWDQATEMLIKEYEQIIKKRK